MDSWIWQGGFPLVSVSLRDGALALSQRRFRFDGGDDAARWDAPLLVRHGAGPDAPVEPVLVGPDGIEVAHRDGGAAVVNAGGHGFVRVRYAEDLRERLAASLAELGPVERYQLVDDTWAATVAGESSAAEFCDVARAFAGETDLPVWQALLLGLGWCERAVEGPARDRFRAFVRQLVRPALDRVGWEADLGDPDLTKALRGALFGALGVLGGDPEVLALAREIDREGRSAAGADPSLATAAASVIAAAGGREEFDAFVVASLAAITPQEELRYLGALSEFRDRDLLRRALERTLGEAVRPQNVPHLISRAIANREVGASAWAFVREHWDDIAARTAPSALIYATIGIRALTDPALVADVQAFFAEHPIRQSALQLRQVLELQRVYAAFVTRARVQLEQWFGA